MDNNENIVEASRHEEMWKISLHDYIYEIWYRTPDGQKETDWETDNITRPQERPFTKCCAEIKIRIKFTSSGNLNQKIESNKDVWEKPRDDDADGDGDNDDNDEDPDKNDDEDDDDCKNKDANHDDNT